MGMTDRQFDVYLKSLLRDLERVRNEITESGTTSNELERMIKDIEEHLRRP